jgi:hypothetical protein
MLYKCSNPLSHTSYVAQHKTSGCERSFVFDNTKWPRLVAVAASTSWVLGAADKDRWGDRRGGE